MMPPSGSGVLVRVTLSLSMSSTLHSNHTQWLDFQSLEHLLLASVLQHMLFVNHRAQCVPRQGPTYSLCPICFLVDTSGAPPHKHSRSCACPTFLWMPYYSEWESPIFKTVEQSLFEMQPKHLEELIWVFPHLYIGICDTLWSSLASFPWSLKTVNSSQELSLASHHWTCRACTAHASLLNSFIYTLLLIILGWPKSSFRFVSKIVPKTSTNFLASEILLALRKHLLHAGPHSTHLTFIIQLSLKNPLR